MLISDYELELHFNSIAEKYPAFYWIEDFDTRNWDDADKLVMQNLINKWNDRMSMMKSALPDKDIGVSPIVSDPYPVTRELRKKERLQHTAEWHRRRAEHYDLMAKYYEDSNV